MEERDSASLTMTGIVRALRIGRTQTSEVFIIKSKGVKVSLKDQVQSECKLAVEVTRCSSKQKRLMIKKQLVKKHGESKK